MNRPFLGFNNPFLSPTIMKDLPKVKIRYLPREIYRRVREFNDPFLPAFHFGTKVFAEGRNANPFH